MGLTKNVQIDRLVEMALPGHQEEIEPFIRYVTIHPSPDPKNDFPENGTRKAGAMGDFYNYVTRGLFGGSLEEKFRIRVDGEEEVSLRVDVLDEDNKRGWESKGSIIGGQTCNILDYQIRKYRFFQYLFPEVELSYIIFRQKIKRIKAGYSGTEKQLYQDLTKATAYAIIIPFSLMTQMHDTSQMPHELVLRYDGPQYDDCTCLKSPMLNTLLVDPAEVIRRMGLNHRNYEFERRRMPEGFYVNHRKMTPIPTLEIKDKNYSEWVEKLRREIDKEGPRLELIEEVKRDDVPF